jgi:hypothetical protein
MHAYICRHQYIVSIVCLVFFNTRSLELLSFLTTFRSALSVSSHLMYLYLLPIGAAVKPWSLVSESNTVLVLGSCSVYYFADRTALRSSFGLLHLLLLQRASERHRWMIGLICSCSPLMWSGHKKVLTTYHSATRRSILSCPPRSSSPTVRARDQSQKSKSWRGSSQQQLRSMTWQLAHSDYDDSPSG